MEYKIEDYRHGLLILEKDEKYSQIWTEIKKVISNISEEMIIKKFEEKTPNNKSISRAVNMLFKEEFKKLSWKLEGLIFQDPDFNNDAWKLDFVKEGISLEVAFNHSGTIAWNLLKPSIASELNHIKKETQTNIGVVICATEELRNVGGFDGAIGTFRNYIKHTLALRTQLTVPMVIIGLEAPNIFHIEHYQNPKNPKNKIGKIIRHNSTSMENL